MEKMMNRREFLLASAISLTLIALAIVLVTFLSVDVSAQVQIPGVKVKPVLKTTLSGDDTKEVIISSAEFAPGVELPRHTHTGDDYTVVLQGTLELIVEGSEPRQVSAGEAFHVPSGLVHRTRVLGDTPVRIIAFWVVEKGKPAMQPVTK
jgi:quercetin dioxygenase-like cupin family protein